MYKAKCEDCFFYQKEGEATYGKCCLRQLGLLFEWTEIDCNSFLSRDKATNGEVIWRILDFLKIDYLMTEEGNDINAIDLITIDREEWYSKPKI